MTIIADATALILLAKVTILEKFVNRNAVITSKMVYQEVIAGKEKGRKDSILVEKIFQEKKLKLKKPVKSIKKKIKKLFNLKAGELEVISLAYKTKHTILSDDKKCLNVAKGLGIDFITSLDIIVALYRKSVIAKEKALECIDELEEYGWYSRDLIKNYKEAIK